MRTFLLLLCALSIQSYAASRTLTYEPAVVELTGILDSQVFPGPPNYESIKDGDEIEDGYYLKLDLPVDVLPRGEHPTVDNPQEERRVRIMQLAINGEDHLLWERFRKAGKGGHVKIKGTLFHRFNGHHHSRVLLSVRQMEPLEP